MANKTNNKVAKDVKKNSKDKKSFMKGFRGELKKVIWPTPKQLLSNTIAVVTIVAIITVIVLVLDLGFKALNDQGINRLRTVVTNETENNVIEDNSTSENNTQDNSVDQNTAQENTTTETPTNDTTTENVTENVNE